MAEYGNEYLYYDAVRKIETGLKIFLNIR